MSRRIQAEYPDASILCVAGGEQRQDSVLCGLDACDPATDFVLVHDGVRPFVSEDEVTRLIDAAREAGAAIPVCPVKNTIKHLESGWVAETVPRKNLVEVYTPQVFSYELLYRLHKQARKYHRYFTDDAAILEYYKKPIKALETSDRNLKITRPFDLEIAAILLEKGSN
jgi:2-C-methyl-D-erythritol 4-phosphate cytidylyltransferase